MRIQSIALTSMAVAIAAHAQTVGAGDLVRIRARPLGIEGAEYRLLAAGSDSLMLASAKQGRDTLVLARASIQSIEVHHVGTTRGHAGGGFVIGGLLGGLAGMSLAAVDAELNCAVAGVSGATSCAHANLAGGFLGGVAIGGGIGALVGLAIRTRKWTKGDPSAVSVARGVAVAPTWTPAQRGVGFAVQVRF